MYEATTLPVSDAHARLFTDIANAVLEVDNVHRPVVVPMSGDRVYCYNGEPITLINPVKVTIFIAADSGIEEGFVVTRGITIGAGGLTSEALHIHGYSKFGENLLDHIFTIPLHEDADGNYTLFDVIAMDISPLLLEQGASLTE